MGRKVRLRRFTGPPRSWVETFQTVSLGSSVIEATLALMRRALEGGIIPVGIRQLAWGSGEGD
jgi:hypothetical protein